MEKEIEYFVGDTRHVGYLATDSEKQRPVILVCHAFEGRNDLAIEYARFFKEFGYVGFAVDFFGEKKVEDTLQGCMSKITPFFEDRSLVKKTFDSVLKALEEEPFVDTEKVGAIGFCFGGMCALDLARHYQKVRGAISVHGILQKPAVDCLDKITAKVLAFHGYQDPQVSEEQTKEFMQEMHQKGADWQLCFLGNAKHAFTDPHASEIGSKEMGREYNELATQRMKKGAMLFFQEIFSN